MLGENGFCDDGTRTARPNDTQNRGGPPFMINTNCHKRIETPLMDDKVTNTDHRNNKAGGVICIQHKLDQMLNQNVTRANFACGLCASIRSGPLSNVQNSLSPPGLQIAICGKPDHGTVTETPR